MQKHEITLGPPICRGRSTDCELDGMPILEWCTKPGVIYVAVPRPPDIRCYCEEHAPKPPYGDPELVRLARYAHKMREQDSTWFEEQIGAYEALVDHLVALGYIPGPEEAPE